MIALLQMQNTIRFIKYIQRSKLYANQFRDVLNADISYSFNVEAVYLPSQRSYPLKQGNAAKRAFIGTFEIFIALGHNLKAYSFARFIRFQLITNVLCEVQKMQFLAQKSSCFLLSVQNFGKKRASKAKNQGCYKKLAQCVNYYEFVCPCIGYFGRGIWQKASAGPQNVPKPLFQTPDQRYLVRSIDKSTETPANPHHRLPRGGYPVKRRSSRKN